MSPESYREDRRKQEGKMRKGRGRGAGEGWVDEGFINYIMKI